MAVRQSWVATVQYGAEMMYRISPLFVVLAPLLALGGLVRRKMLLITMVVVFVYGAAVGHSLGSGSWVLEVLPKLHNTLLLLALISHSGYVVGKLIPSNLNPSVLLPGPTVQSEPPGSAAAPRSQPQTGLTPP